MWEGGMEGWRDGGMEGWKVGRRRKGGGEGGKSEGEVACEGMKRERVDCVSVDEK
jgi:hypothetical protein